MNQIKDERQLTMTDLRKLGLEGGATARLENGEEVVLRKGYGTIRCEALVSGERKIVDMIVSYSAIYPHIRTIKRHNHLIARRIKRGKSTILQSTGKGYRKSV